MHSRRMSFVLMGSKIGPIGIDEDQYKPGQTIPMHVLFKACVVIY